MSCGSVVPRFHRSRRSGKRYPTFNRSSSGGPSGYPGQRISAPTAGRGRTRRPGRAGRALVDMSTESRRRGRLAAGSAGGLRAARTDSPGDLASYLLLGLGQADRILRAVIANCERSIGAARWHGSVGWHSRSLVIKSDQVWSYPVTPRVPGATALIYDNTHFGSSFSLPIHPAAADQ